MEPIKQQRVRVKVCGTTCIEDALVAVASGVDGLGFIFYAKSPRYIAPGKASRIIDQLPPLVDKVGVFVNSPLDDLMTAAEAGLSYVQLHGEESVEYCREVRERAPYLGIIKAFRVGEVSQPKEFSLYNECVDAFLLDTYVEGTSGGTGKVFDWSLIEKLDLQRPIFLAGGLSPENIVEAIRAVRPFAVDVNSGVEASPGRKNHNRLRELMRLVSQTSSL